MSALPPLDVLPGDVLERGEGRRAAIFSAPEGGKPAAFRYALDIPLAPQRGLFAKPNVGVVLFVMLNPSTADQNVNDPTITRVQNFASSWGYAGVRIVNLFAYRSTNPDRMAKVSGGLQAAAGTNNLAYIEAAAAGCDRIVAAWGGSLNRAPFYKEQLRTVLSILSKSGAPVSCIDRGFNTPPMHPLYLPADFTPKPFEWRARVRVQLLDLPGNFTYIMGDYLTTPEEAVDEALRNGTVGEEGDPTYLECVAAGTVKTFRVMRENGKVVVALSRVDAARRRRTGPKEIRIRFAEPCAELPKVPLPD